tara:strand:+ start:852 stop:1451 length:600 start_codon:yes stop_codon:yes gene_type:complete
MSQIPQLMGERALEHGIAMAVDHGGGSSSKMYVGGQANASVAAGITTVSDTTENMAAQYKIPADTLVAGSTIRVRFVCLTSDQGGDDLTIRLRFGKDGSTMTNDTECAVNTPVTQADGDFSVGDIIIQVRTTTTAVAFGTIADSDALGSKLVSAQFEPSFTIDATKDNYVSVTTQWDGSNADNKCTTQAFVVDIVNPKT